MNESSRATIVALINADRVYALAYYKAAFVCDTYNDHVSIFLIL